MSDWAHKVHRNTAWKRQKNCDIKTEKGRKIETGHEMANVQQKNENDRKGQNKKCKREGKIVYWKEKSEHKSRHKDKSGSCKCQ